MRPSSRQYYQGYSLPTALIDIMRSCWQTTLRRYATLLESVLKEVLHDTLLQHLGYNILHNLV